MGERNGLATSLSFRGKLVRATNNPFHVPREWGIGAVLVGHECLVFGGHRGGARKHRIYKYDLLTSTWKAILPKNPSKDFGEIRATFVVDDTLYACVWLNLAMRNVLMTIDLVSMEEWMPTREDDSAQLGSGTTGSYVEARNELVLFGGKGNGVAILVYSLSRSSWYLPNVSGNPPAPRYNHATCCSGRRMFVIGGESIGLEIAPLDLHVLCLQSSRISWSTPITTGHAPTQRHHFTATYVDGRIFVYGGFSGLAHFDFYTVSENRWYIGSSSEASEQEGMAQFVSELTGGNAYHAAVAVGDKLLVLGGCRLNTNTALEITAF